MAERDGLYLSEAALREFCLEWIRKSPQEPAAAMARELVSAMSEGRLDPGGEYEAAAAKRMSQEAAALAERRRGRMESQRGI